MAKSFFKKYPFLVLLAFLLAAYLPVFLPFFHLKNDLISQNLPTRFVISESLYSHCFPWWNPYINFGIPQYGDMNSGYWNPFLWLIARTSGYSIWAITLEEMTYILLGGWGIYLLCRNQRTSLNTALLTAVSYMGSGYILGHLQHFCWITGAAFFPYVLLYFVRIHRAPVWANFVGGGISVAFFVSATHPGLVIGAIYFFFFAHLGIWLLRKNAFQELYHPRFWAVSALFLFISLLFSIVVVVSNIDVLRHIPRGHMVSLAQALWAPTTLPSYLSLIFPTAVQHGSFFNTDVSMRNTYIGIALLAGLFPFLRYAARRFLIVTLAVLLFFILLSAGGWFKELAYWFIPFAGNVRLNGEFSYFVTLIMLMGGAWGLEKHPPAAAATPNLKRLLYRLAAGCGSIAALSIAMMIFFPHPLATAQTLATQPMNWKQTIKGLVDASSFWQLLLIGSLLQGATLLFIAVRGLKNHTLLLAIVANFVGTTWLILPFTGLGMASKASREELITTFPKGIHPQEQAALKDTRFISDRYFNDLVLLGDYSKKIGYPHQELYPVEISSAKTLYADTTLFSFICRQSFLFLSADTTTAGPTAFDTATIRITAFCTNKLQASVKNQSFHFLTYLQNDYPYWKIKVDGRSVPHFTGFRTFLTIPLSKGEHRIEYDFDPAPIRTMLWINLGILLAALLSLCFAAARQWQPLGSA